MAGPLLGAAALMSGQAWALLAVLFGLGMQATFFGPLKYGILPQHLRPGELLAGNALVEAATFAAILLGTILGGVLIAGPHGPKLVGCVVVAVAAVGLVAAWAVPAAAAAAPGLAIGWNSVAGAIGLLRAARAEPEVWRASLGISWFWAFGATYLAVFAPLVRDVFGGGNDVVTLLLAGFALGIGAGSIAAGRLAGGRIETRHLAAAAAAMTVLTLGFALLCTAGAARGWSSVGGMLTSPSGLLAWLCLLGTAMAGGVFSLPLYATIQQRADPASRARMVAANNVMNALAMVLGAGAIAALSAAGLGSAGILAVAAVLNAGVAWAWRVRPTRPRASPVPTPRP